MLLVNRKCEYLGKGSIHEIVIRSEDAHSGEGGNGSEVFCVGCDAGHISWNDEKITKSQKIVTIQVTAI